MSALLIIVVLMVAVINIANYSQINLSAMETLELLAENSGTYPDSIPSRQNNDPPSSSDPQTAETSEPDASEETDAATVSDTTDEEDTSAGSDIAEEPEDATAASNSSDGPGRRSGTSSEEPGGGASDGIDPSQKNEPRSFPENDVNETRRIEAPYETRYFSVNLDADGNVLSTDTSHIAAVSEDIAQEYALTVYYKGRTSGAATSYRYLAVTQEDGGILVVFVDCSSSLAEARQLMFASLGVGAAALALMFALVWLFSGRSVAPVVESLDKQKRFISDAGHELKTPITIISANVDVLEMIGERSEWTQSIRTQTVRLTDLVNNMLTLSRMEEDSLPIVFTDVDFSSLVHECATTFDAVAQAGNLDYSVAVRDGLHVNGDPTSLRQLCTILLDNAMKYSSERGSIYLSLHLEKKDSGRIGDLTRKGDSGRRDELATTNESGGRNAKGRKGKSTRQGNVILEVSNTCDSIPEGNLDRLFDRFYRADSSRTRESRATWHVAPDEREDPKAPLNSDNSLSSSETAGSTRSGTGGFGIGLSVAKAVVTAHGGTISAHIDGDRLIRFEVILPEKINETADSPSNDAHQNTLSFR